MSTCSSAGASTGPKRPESQVVCIDTAIEQIRQLAIDTYCVRVAAPEIARTVVPGQFVMIRLSGRESPLIGRALAVYDVIDDASGSPCWIDLAFIRKGALTTPLSESPAAITSRSQGAVEKPLPSGPHTETRVPAGDSDSGVVSAPLRINARTTQQGEPEASPVT